MQWLKKTVVLGSVVAVLAAGWASAEMGGGYGGGPHGNMPPDMEECDDGSPCDRPMEKNEEMMEKKMTAHMEKLGLSDDQKEQMRKHHTEEREKAMVLHKELRNQQDALRTELNKTQSDPKTIETLSRDIKDLQGKLVDHRTNAVLSMKKILTPAQHEQFIKDMEAQWGKMKEKGRGEGKKDGRRMHQKP